MSRPYTSTGVVISKSKRTKIEICKFEGKLAALKCENIREAGLTFKLQKDIEIVENFHSHAVKILWSNIERAEFIFPLPLCTFQEYVKRAENRIGLPAIEIIALCQLLNQLITTFQKPFLPEIMVYEGKYGNRLFLISGIDESSFLSDETFRPEVAFRQREEEPWPLLKQAVRLSVSDYQSTSTSEMFSFKEVQTTHEKTMTLVGELLLLAISGKSPISIYGTRDEEELTAAEESARTMLQEENVMFIELIYREGRLSEIRKIETLEETPRIPPWLYNEILTMIKSCLYDGGRTAIQTLKQVPNWAPYIFLSPNIMRLDVLSGTSTEGRFQDVEQGIPEVNVKFTSPKYRCIVSAVLSKADITIPTITDILGSDWKSRISENPYRSGLRVMNEFYETYEFLDTMESMARALFERIPQMTCCIMFLEMGATHAYERNAHLLEKYVMEYQTSLRVLSDFCRQKRIVHAEVEWKCGNPEHNINNGALFLARAVEHYADFRNKLIRIWPAVENIFRLHQNIQRWMLLNEYNVLGFLEMRSGPRFGMYRCPEFECLPEERAEHYKAFLSRYVQQVFHCHWESFDEGSDEWAEYVSNVEDLVNLLRHIVNPLCQTIEGVLKPDEKPELLGDQMRQVILKTINKRLKELPLQNGNETLRLAILSLVETCECEEPIEELCNSQRADLMHILMHFHYGYRIASYANIILPSLLEQVEPVAGASTSSSTVFQPIQERKFKDLLKLYEAIGLHPE